LEFNLEIIIFLITLFVVGACVGSFLNVAIYRIPLENINIISPKRSFCPNCKAKIKFYHNIPLLSYILLLGKCAYCKAKISFNYFSVELLSALLFVLVFLHFKAINLESIVFLLICLNLILLSFIDFKLKAVPDYLLVSIIIFALIIGDISNFLFFMGGAFLLDFMVTFYVQNIKYAITKNKELLDTKALGEGDMPIFGLMGAILGLKLGLVAIFVSAIIALIPSIIALVTKKEIHIAFIPYLSIGFIFVFFMQEYIMINL
jgi:leader peptidase (prepilin peptidase)/N-methyltransferase